jgi:glycosyltransferase involved in cell wall biosynthesis
MSPTRFLFSTAEKHPCSRPDVEVLFGKELPRLGVLTDLVAISDYGESLPWGGGRALLRSAGASKIKQTLADLVQQLKLFRYASKQYKGLIVRDKPVFCIIGFLAALWAGIPYAYWMSFPLPEAHLELARTSTRIGWHRRAVLWLRGALGHWLLNRLLLNRVDWLFVQSEFMAQDLRKRGLLRHDRVSAVPMGVDFQALDFARGELPSSFSGRRIAVYLGSLDRLRKPELMVDAALLVAQQMPDFLLLVIGEADEPSEVGWLREYAQTVNALGTVHFTGRLPRQEALRLAAFAQVGLSPIAPNPLFEVSSPTKPLEYWALEIPVVANDIPDQKKVIEQSGGGWCVEFSAQAFATAILQCLRDPLQAKERAQKGRQWVSTHRSYSAIAERLVQQCDLFRGSSR